MFNLRQSLIPLFFLITIFCGHAYGQDISSSNSTNITFQNIFLPTVNGKQEYDIIATPVCDVYTTKFNFWKMQTEIIKFSTFKLNPCGLEGLQNIALASIKSQIETIVGSARTYKSGPNYFLMDSNLSPVTKPYIYIGMLKFFASATGTISSIDYLTDSNLREHGFSQAYYQPFTIKQDIYYVWNSGSIVHELIPPSGKGSYVMVTYSRLIAPTLDSKNLSQILNFETIPDGWVYRQRVLERPFTIRSRYIQEYKTQMIWDQLQNFYIWVPQE